MKNRIIWKFFAAFIFLALIVIFILNFFVSWKLRDDFERRITEKLRSNAILVGRILSNDLAGGTGQPVRDKVRSLSDQLKLRITVIDEQGRVLADSQTDASLMENHKGRIEVSQAIKTGFGQSTRFSDTLQYNMKYVAVRVEEDDSVLGVVRFALPLSEVQLEIQVIYRAVLFGALPAVLIALAAAYFVSKSITSPIGEMKETARQIAKGDFSRRVSVSNRDELGELARSLNKMAEELQQKIDNLRRMDRMRTDFVANVSHELKTPLTLIRGYIETLQDKAMNDPEKARKFVSIIKEHANRLGNIIDDLLSLSELELSKDSINKTAFDLKEVLNDVALGFGYAVAANKQRLTINAQGSDFAIEADRDKLEQLFVNLIDNATKYTGQGGQVEVLLSEEADALAVTVKDDGIGIPREHLDRVFERFYRVDKARSRKMGGTGLGLGIAKHIVLAHNGQINIQSEIGRGTKVFVTLPKK